MTYVIRYRSGGTISGKPIGLVYVEKCEWGTDVFSYTKNPVEATHYTTEAEAEAVVRARHWWPEAIAVPLADAGVLP